jgi:PST family polysaccharide transporter
MSENIKRQAIRGAGFQTIGGIIQVIIRLAGSMILARLLTPADFGIFALTTLVFGLFIQFSLLAAPQAIVAKRNISQKQLNSIFVLNIVIHLLISIIIFITSNYIGLFYDEPRLGEILKVISILTLITAFRKVPNALLTRDMKFHYVNIIGILSAIVEVGVAILVVVYYQHNFWGLVWGLVSAEVIMTILVIMTAQWKPTLTFSSNAFIYFLRYGTHLTGENVTTYFRQNIDYFVIGKLLGANALGIYSFAYRIPNLVNARLISPASGVIMPYMSKLKDDEQLIEAYFTFTKLIPYVGFPLLVILFVLSKPIILLMWGEQWHDAIDPLKILVAVSAINMLGLPLGSVFLKKSRPDLLFKTAMMKLPVTFLVVLGMGYWGGIMGIAYGMAFSGILAIGISFIYLQKIIPVSTSRLFKSLFPATVSSLIAALIGYYLDTTIVTLGYLFEIVIISSAIVLIYLSTVLVLFKNDFHHIKNLLQKSLRKSNA